MITQITTRRGKTISLIESREDLPRWQIRGGHIRAFCPIHGSDHQRSLSIHIQTGWGYCHQCQAHVFLAELDPEKAEHLCNASHSNTSVPAQQMKPLPPVEPPHWQQAEVQALHQIHPSLQDALAHPRSRDHWLARDYLCQRGISLEIALQEGIGFLSEGLLLHHHRFAHLHKLLWRWRRRIIFPLRSPQGNGFIGRTLWGWQRGMSEQEHKTQLGQSPNAPPRWLKTNPAGWFCSPPRQWPSRIALVESGFDRLSLLSAGVPTDRIAAIAGTSFRHDWLPEQVQSLIIGLNNDQAGQQAALHIQQQCDRETIIALPPADAWGGDWNERWQTRGLEGVMPLLTQLKASSPTVAIDWIRRMLRRHPQLAQRIRKDYNLAALDQFDMHTLINILQAIEGWQHTHDSQVA